MILHCSLLKWNKSLANLTVMGKVLGSQVLVRLLVLQLIYANEGFNFIKPRTHNSLDNVSIEGTGKKARGKGEEGCRKGESKSSFFSLSLYLFDVLLLLS